MERNKGGRWERKGEGWGEEGGEEWWRGQWKGGGGWVASVKKEEKRVGGRNEGVGRKDEGGR